MDSKALIDFLNVCKDVCNACVEELTEIIAAIRERDKLKQKLGRIRECHKNMLAKYKALKRGFRTMQETRDAMIRLKDGANMRQRNEWMLRIEDDRKVQELTKERDELRERINRACALAEKVGPYAKQVMWPVLKGEDK